MDDQTRQRFDALDRQLQAIVTRLDEQDASHDRLMGKVDRLSAKIDQLSILSRAGEEAMTSLDALSRRVAKIESALRGENG
jgi:prefoldin subunit 5